MTSEMKMGSKGRDIHGHLWGGSFPILGERASPCCPPMGKGGHGTMAGKKTIPRKKGRGEERQKEHNEESRMQFPVSHSFSLLSSMLPACIRRVVANKQWGHFTAMDRVLSPPRTFPSTLFLSINPENRIILSHR